MLEELQCNQGKKSKSVTKHFLYSSSAADCRIQHQDKQQSNKEDNVPKHVAKCSCAINVLAQRLFLKSHILKVLSSEQLTIYLPPG